MSDHQENQDSTKFKLISLEEQPAVAKKAFNAYSTFSKASSETQNQNTLDFNEESVPEVIIKSEKTQKETKSSQKTRRSTIEESEFEEEEFINESERIDKLYEEIQEEEEKHEKRKISKSSKRKIPKSPTEELQQVVGDITDKLDEFKSSISNLKKILVDSLMTMFVGIWDFVLTPIISISTKLIRFISIPLIGFANFINILVGKIRQKRHLKGVSSGTKSLEEDIKEEEKEEEIKKETPKANFSDMLELNIIFLDNQKNPLYSQMQTRGLGKLGAMEENLIMENAILAIQECAEFTTELPTPSEGIYEGRPIFDIMSEVTKEDIQTFLGFVKAFPGKYIGKKWKISETFATWLINNAPIE